MVVQTVFPKERAWRPDERIQWMKSVPFILLHLLPLGAIWSGASWGDVLLCVGLYYGRMFFVTAGYHRYFSHRTFKTSRVMQFLFAWGAQSSGQKGALWWAGHHRQHHRHSDQEDDVHSPFQGMLWSHVGWILCERFSETSFERIPDMAKYPELRWLNTWHWVPLVTLGLVVFLLGGWGAFFIGFALSTIMLYHGTFLVNSLAHVVGKRRYETTDDSRNCWWIALLTLGEGWHNNHHAYPNSTRQGFFWWEVDISYYILKAMAMLGLVWGLRPPPIQRLAASRIQSTN